MHFNRLAHPLLDLFTSGSRRHTARQIGRIGREIVRCSFDYDQVTVRGQAPTDCGFSKVRVTSPILAKTRYKTNPMIIAESGGIGMYWLTSFRLSATQCSAGTLSANMPMYLASSPAEPANEADGPRYPARRVETGTRARPLPAGQEVVGGHGAADRAKEAPITTNTSTTLFAAPVAASRMLTSVPRPTEMNGLTLGSVVLKLLAAMNDEKHAGGKDAMASKNMNT